MLRIGRFVEVKKLILEWISGKFSSHHGRNENVKVVWVSKSLTINGIMLVRLDADFRKLKAN